MQQSAMSLTFYMRKKILQELRVFFSNQMLPEASKRTACKFLISTETTFLHLCKPDVCALIHNSRKKATVKPQQQEIMEETAQP